METKANYFLIGLFALLVTIGAALFVLWLSRAQFNEQFAFYDVRFDDGVTGLPVGGEVRYSGVNVGTVEAIRFDPAAPSVVYVTIKVAHRRDFAIRQDAQVSLQFAGITGITYILITGGNAKSPILPIVTNKDRRLPVLVAQPSAVKQLMKDAPEIATKTREVLDRLNRVLTPENAEKVSRIIDNFDRMSANLADASLDAKAAAKEAPGALAEIKTASRSVADLGHLGQAVVAENRAAVNDFSVRSLSQLSALTAEARQLIATLDRIATHAEGDPAHYVLGGNPPAQEVPIRK